MLLQVPGFVAGSASAGLKKGGNKDLGMIFSEVPACAAGVFTTNQVQAAPVLLDKKRIKSGRCQAIVANSGNANACTGKQGIEDAKAVARAAAAALKIPEEMVLVGSTGVIGQRLNISAIEAAVPKLADQLSPSGLYDVAQAIMTTDSFPKTASRQGSVGDKTFTVAAVAKGAGMIRPDLATMLCFICTDIGARPDLLGQALKDAVAGSFNTITVDGDTSTNDTVLLLANGLSGLNLQDAACATAFQEVLNDVLFTLALQIVRDGEGATKLVTIEVRGASSKADATRVAYAVANSLLVKTALFGEDANWGRIMAAVGRSGVPINLDRIDIYFDDVRVVKHGLGCGKEAEAAATKVLKADHFSMVVDLKLGSKSAMVHTCDLSTDYVRINADYRS
ncbi:MAG: bifunctional glutamate N-acetyltransferase/amino-acid acetyltransferase ArgJ [Deltaproteobacteria bacterium]|nr:bifunctional glutamate N-acetyltransferase/amino-acid acetyltransferase ArgJ [Deltaproteobacteria bacterium]MBW2019479.1 bifunctional glutamate N-acetyltransferase/amino-acid acetyltransferase ArgJ [Deltaproteobacteria bacterium]MBW2074316.1 bifunctional glutamate N-acetyltransferase/amino-acid acetyltransferase ArgJ [Deltaproteobacteria bacterium]RLB82152.1 MAG: ornithine acetyltransferase [Deltaproteobacteria bacterium]